MSPTPYDFIIFDVGHTLAWPNLQGMSDIAMRILQIPVTQTNLANGDRDARRAINGFVKQHGHASTVQVGTNIPTSVEAYYRCLLEEDILSCNTFPLKVIKRLFAAWWSHQILENWFTVVGPDVLAALKKLRDLGQPMGIISNSEGEIERLLTMLGLRPYFQFVVDSGVVGVAKPDPAIFRLAASLADTTPERCLYVGDQPDVDIRGALAVGMRAIHYDPQGVYTDMAVPGTIPCRNLLDLADAATSPFLLSRFIVPA